MLVTSSISWQPENVCVIGKDAYAKSEVYNEKVLILWQKNKKVFTHLYNRKQVIKFDGQGFEFQHEQQTF